MQEPNADATAARSRPVSLATAGALGLACLALHLAFNGGYGVFRDELYFIVCGLHPAFGYVDQPPLVPLVAGLVYKLFGTALTPLRLLPALAMSATVALTAAFAGRLGGGRFAQALAGLATLLAPVLLVGGLLLSTDMLGPLTWLGCSWCLVRLVETRDERWWIPFGAIVGVSWQCKYLIAFYVAGLAIGVVATPLRRSLGRPWLYAGAAVALALAAPNLAWQATHGWPFLEIGAAGVAGKNVAFSPQAFLGQEILFVGPASALVWIVGLWRLATWPEAPEFRVFPIAWAVLFVLFVASHGKPYYLTPLVPTLYAAGAVAWEKWLGSRIARLAAVAVLVIPGLVVLPLGLPILSPERLIAYQRAIGMGPSATAMERGRQSALPQYFADMFGWREMAAAVTKVYRALTAADRAKAVFYGRNYGEAAALDVYGPGLGGPPAISAHNSYYEWGTRGFDGSVVIMVGGDQAQLARVFAEVEVAGRIDNPYAMPYETGIPILVLRKLREPLAELWPKLKHFE